MLLVAILTLLMPMLAGVVAMAAGRLFEEKILLTSAGAVGGLSVFITSAYVVSLVAPMHLVTVGALLVVTALLAGVLLAITPAWRHWAALPTDRIGLIILGLSVLIAGAFGAKVLFLEETGLATSVLNVWGDVAWHMANITLFAEGQSVPPENPILAGTRLTYPFLVNFGSALLLAVHHSYAASVALPAFLLLTLTFVLCYCLGREFGGSRAAGVLTLLLFITMGATLGWTQLPSDWQTSNLSLLEFLRHLPRDYSGAGSDANGYHFLNPILALLLPQRSFLFGMPLAFSILLLLLRARHRHDLLPFIYAGALAGLLPLFHAHTVLALIPALLGVYVWHTQEKVTNWRWHKIIAPAAGVWQGWLIFALVALIVGLPEVLYYATGSGAEGSFARWGPGWTAGETNWVWHWLKNTGVLLPLVGWSLLRPAPRTPKLLALAGLAIFVAANLWLFAPWAWDNFKLLIFWLLFSLPLISVTLVTWWQSGQRVWQVAVVLIIVVQGLSGTIDLLKTSAPSATAWGEWDTETIAFAEAIREQSPPGSAILTAPYHNNPAALAGRPIYLGFTGHVWSHGGDVSRREPAIKAFYEGGLATLPETDVEYVVVGPVERQQFPALVVRPEWTLIVATPSYQLYRLP